MEASSNSPRTRGVGAVSRGDGPKRRGLWWLLAALLLLAAIIAILIIALSGGSKHKKAGAQRATPSSVTASTAATPAPAAAQPPATSSQPAASGATASAGAGQVGGGGVAAHAATGKLAPSGSVGAVLFAEAGVALDADAHRVIATAVKEIGSDHARSVTVIGYTDKIGNAKANETLSLERARAVARSISKQLKGSSTSLKVEAKGQSHAVASNSTPTGRQLNRRVEIFVKP